MPNEEYRWKTALEWLFYSCQEDPHGVGLAELLEFITDKVDPNKIQEHFHDAMEEDGFFEPLPKYQDPEGSPRSAGDWAHP